MTNNADEPTTDSEKKPPNELVQKSIERTKSHILNIIDFMTPPEGGSDGYPTSGDGEQLHSNQPQAELKHSKRLPRSTSNRTRNVSVDRKYYSQTSRRSKSEHLTNSGKCPRTVPVPDSLHEYYKVSFQGLRSNSPPRRFIFDLVEHDRPFTPQTHAQKTHIPNISTDKQPYPHRKTFVEKLIEKTVPRNYHVEDRMKSPLIGNVHDLNFTKQSSQVPFKDFTDVVHKGSADEDVGVENSDGKRNKWPGRRVDLYYFDHGNLSYLQTTDTIPTIQCELIAEKTDVYATKFWSEIFGSIHIAAAFVTSFFLQFLRFALYALVRPLTVGVIQILSDYLLKPLLTVIYNGIVQPPLICCYNVATSVRDCCEPIAECFGFFIEEFAQLFRACRLIEVNRNVNGRKHFQNKV